MAKRYAPKLTFQAVLEVLSSEKSVGQVSEAYRIHANSIKHWKQTFLEKGAEIFAKNSSVAEYERPIAELERLVGQNEVEIALSRNRSVPTP